MIQQTATKNLQSEYVPEDGEALDEEGTIDELSKKTLGRYTKKSAADLGNLERMKGFNAHVRRSNRAGRRLSSATQDADNKHSEREIKNRKVGIGRAVNRLAKTEETIEENAMDTLKKIVSRQTAETIKLDDGSRIKVDMTTANALLGVHGALNMHNQKKMADTLNSNKAGFAKMSKFAFKQFGSRPGKVGTPSTGVREANEVVYTKAEREAAAKRAKANREKRAAERKKKSSNDDSDYDKGNYPGYWTDKDEEYKKIKSQIKELASRIEVQ
jgi:hypothetical protein